MGRAKATQGKKGFRANSKDGRFLRDLLVKKKVSGGITPGALRELYSPRFDEYKNDSFAACLRRMKTKYGINVRGDTGKSSNVLSISLALAI